MLSDWKDKVESFDERRDLVIVGPYNETIQYCVDQFISLAEISIRKQNYFAVALSGGSTPKAIYHSLASPQNRDKIDWTKVLLFWSDERSVPPNDKESNYHMALEAGLGSLPIKSENIFRMKAEENIEENACEYENLILTKIPNKVFDLVLLGLGEDGHIASLFPKTHGLKIQNKLVIGNFIPQKDTWRMTLTYECINSAKCTVLYVLGKSKAEIAARVLLGTFEPDLIPAQKIGTLNRRALWIMDNDAAELVNL